MTVKQEAQGYSGTKDVHSAGKRPRWQGRDKDTGNVMFAAHVSQLQA